MKKLLTGLLAVLTCFTCATAVACGDNNGNNNNSNNAATTDLEGAKDYLYGMYINQDVEVRKDYEVVNTVYYDGVSYSITWTVSGADSVSVKPGSSDVMSLIDVDETTTEQVNYTLTATISDGAGNTVSVSFERSVVALEGDSIMTPEENVAYNMYIEQMTLKENLFLTGNMNGKFFEMTTENAEAANVYAEVVEGGYKFYLLGEADAKSYITLTEYDKGGGKWGASVSYSETGSVFYFDAVGVWACELENDTFFLGTYGSYNTTSASASYYMKAENIGSSQYPLLIALPGTIQGGTHEGAPVVQEPAADSELTIAEAIALGEELQRDTQNKYYISGTITSITQETYGNMYINDGNGNEILVYGTYSADGTVRYDAMETKPVVGDTVKLYSIVSYFNGAPQLKNAWIIEINAGSGSETPPEGGEDPVDPPAGEVTWTAAVPEAGKPYIFGMTQANVDNTVYYLAGGMDGFYMATTTDPNAAIETYIEATEGGYYFYTYVGETKTYINMVVSGTHVNGAYEATASTVYTIDETNKTLIAIVNDAEYWFGTRNDKTYTTMGPCAVSYAGFFGVFYTNGQAGGEVTPPAGGEDPADPPVDGGETEEYVKMSITEALKAANGAKVEITGTVSKLYEAWSSYNNMSPYITDGTDEILIFRTTTKVSVGDIITVKGVITVYNNVNQIAQGTSTVTITTPHTCEYMDATCSAPATCKHCGATTGEIAADAHNYVNHTCSICNGVEPGYEGEVVATESVTISFASTAQRTTFTSDQQIWAEGAATLTNNQASSTSAIADYSNPARFYKSTEITIECANMTKIVFEVNTGKPVSGLTDSLDAAGIAYTVNGNTVTVVFETPVNSIKISCAAQFRLNSMTVSYAK